MKTGNQQRLMKINESENDCDKTFRRPVVLDADAINHHGEVDKRPHCSTRYIFPFALVMTLRFVV